MVSMGQDVMDGGSEMIIILWVSSHVFGSNSQYGYSIWSRWVRNKPCGGDVLFVAIENFDIQSDT